jgi:peptidoglycan/xylan/chitin deacetylase (PgdA/CDA1 family)
MALIALKIDVDTWRGTREGVPPLVSTLQRHRAGATFLFSLGPDHTGRAIRRVFRPGFFGKVSRTSVVEHYGVRTLLYGTLLPGPDIGRKEAALLRSVAQSGFETGVHTWDHVRWQDGVSSANPSWTRAELQRATDRYTEVFGEGPKVHGAAGWQMNENAYRLEGAMGYTLASDGRGHSPYWPADSHGNVLGPLQLPTTLSTLDELIGLDGWDAHNVHQALLQHTAREDFKLHVYTLHAELEGQRLLPVFERLLQGWRDQGHELVSLGQAASRLNTHDIAKCRVDEGTVPGRSGTLAIQGREV